MNPRHASSWIRGRRLRLVGRFCGSAVVSCAIAGLLSAAAKPLPVASPTARPAAAHAAAKKSHPAAVKPGGAASLAHQRPGAVAAVHPAPAHPPVAHPAATPRPAKPSQARASASPSHAPGSAGASHPASRTAVGPRPVASAAAPKAQPIASQGAAEPGKPAASATGAALGDKAPVAAKQPPVIEELSWQEFGLVIKASAPLKPDIFTLEHPARFVLDLPGAELADTALSRTIPLGVGDLRQVRLAKKPRGDVRIVVDCARPVGLQVMQPGDGRTLVLAPAGVSHQALAALLRGESDLPVADQEIRSISAQESADAVVVRLKGAKNLRYALFEEDAGTYQLRVPGGRFRPALPPLAPSIASRTGMNAGGTWTLDLALKGGFFQLEDRQNADKSELTLTFRRIDPRRFANRPLVVIDPGHGGADPGALGPNGVAEKHVNLALAHALQRALWAKRINAVLTRSTDAEMYLAPRLGLIDREKADLLISLHANSHTGAESSGTETYWREAPSLAFATAIHQQITKVLNRPDRGVKQERLYMCRHPRVPSVLVETGFISNPDEEKLLADALFQQQAASAIVAGVEAYWERAKPNVPLAWAP